MAHHFQNIRVQSIEVFSDTTGIYRTFEPSSSNTDPSNPAIITSSTTISSGQANGNTNPHPISASQATRALPVDKQLQQLQESKPTISTTAPTVQETLHSSEGSLWLAIMDHSGELTVRSLPDGEEVFRSSRGISDSVPNFVDEGKAVRREREQDNEAGVNGDGEVNMDRDTVVRGGEEEEEGEEETDGIRQMMFHPLGKEDEVRPHLFVSYTASSRSLLHV